MSNVVKHNRPEENENAVLAFSDDGSQVWTFDHERIYMYFETRISNQSRGLIIYLDICQEKSDIMIKTLPPDLHPFLWSAGDSDMTHHC
nr:hypothetical protein CFP56_79641 [Quercus suber]